MNADFQDAIKFNPPESPFFNGGKGVMIHQIPVNYLSSLWKREAGRDFREGRFKACNCYDSYTFLSNKKSTVVWRADRPRRRV
jgi:hypothetical protein